MNARRDIDLFMVRCTWVEGGRDDGTYRVLEAPEEWFPRLEAARDRANWLANAGFTAVVVDVYARFGRTAIEDGRGNGIGDWNPATRRYGR